MIHLKKVAISFIKPLTLARESKRLFKTLQSLFENKIQVKKS